jgi:NAD-dependent SIR2 family protein deacetylase
MEVSSYYCPVMETTCQLYHNCSLRLVSLHGRLGCNEYELHHCQGSYRSIRTVHPPQMHQQMTPTDHQKKNCSSCKYKGLPMNTSLSSITLSIL